MYKDHRDIKTEVSEIEIAAPYLLERFKNDDEANSMLSRDMRMPWRNYL